MTDKAFLELMRDVLTTEVFVHNASKVSEARKEVNRRLAMLDHPANGNHTIAPPENVTVVP